GADLNAAAGNLAPALQGRLLASDTLIAHADQVNTVVSGAPNLRMAELFTCMLRTPANLGHLVANFGALNAAAGTLNTAPLKINLRASASLIALGAPVNAVLGALHVPPEPLLDLIAWDPATIPTLNAHAVHLNRALGGQPGISDEGLWHVLAHIQLP